MEVLDHGKCDLTAFASRKSSGAPVCVEPVTRSPLRGGSRSPQSPAPLGPTVPLQLRPPSCAHSLPGGLSPASPCSGRTAALLGCFLSPPGNPCGVRDFLSQPLAQPPFPSSWVAENVSCFPSKPWAALLGLRPNQPTTLADTEAEPTTCQAQPLCGSPHGPSATRIPPQGGGDGSLLRLPGAWTGANAG